MSRKAWRGRCGGRSSRATGRSSNPGPGGPPSPRTWWVSPSPSTTAGNSCPFSSRKTWWVTSSGSFRQPARSTAIRATGRPRGRSRPRKENGDGSESDGKVHACLPEEGAARGGPDPRKEHLRCADGPEAGEQGVRQNGEEGARLRRCERRPDGRDRHRHPVREEGVCGRGGGHEEVPSRADGAGPPVPEADQRHHHRGRREVTGKQRTEGRRLLGQKGHPYGFRLGIIKDWRSRWYSEKDYAANLQEDLRIRSYVKKRLIHAGVSAVEIERKSSRVHVIIHTARPGIVIGKKGAEIENLKKDLQKFAKKEVSITIQEIRRPETDAQLTAENVAMQLERRIAFRRAMKKTVLSSMKLGAKGIKIHVAGRLGGAEMARSEWYREGRVPLHTLRADIEYGFAEAKTTYGKIGVKVWIYKGEVLQSSSRESKGE